jgi:hypothetical protein
MVVSRLREGYAVGVAPNFTEVRSHSLSLAYSRNMLLIPFLSISTCREAVTIPLDFVP